MLFYQVGGTVLKTVYNCRVFQQALKEFLVKYLRTYEWFNNGT